MVHLVRLKYATTQTFAIGGIPGGVAYTYVRAKVNNVAFEKTVVAHYRQLEAPYLWADIPLKWISHHGSYDVFGLGNDFVTNELVVRATVGGQTEWDNDGGLNYAVPSFRNVVGGNVMLSKANAKLGLQGGGGFVVQTSWFEGEIYVNNLCYAKRVGVWYTADNGASWQGRDAHYVGLAAEGTYAASTGAERWAFQTPELNYDNASPSFVFAVYFQRLDNGDWFWDNNFGQNYTLSKTSSIAIE